MTKHLASSFVTIPFVELSWRTNQSCAQRQLIEPLTSSTPPLQPEPSQVPLTPSILSTQPLQVMSSALMTCLLLLFSEVEDDARNSPLIFTIHVYQYRVEKGARSNDASLGDGFDGGRSRLHLIDLGSCSKGRDTRALGLSALGNVIHALLNGQRQLPYRCV